MSDESGSQFSFVALVLRQIWIDVVGKQKPLSELLSVDGAARRNDVRNVEPLSVLHASAEPPNYARGVHQPIETRIAHWGRLAGSNSIRYPWRLCENADFAAGCERLIQERSRRDSVIATRQIPRFQYCSLRLRLDVFKQSRWLAAGPAATE
jgi:hypothetical protein